MAGLFGGLQPHKTVCNLLDCWSRRSFRLGLFQFLTGGSAVFGKVAIDEMHIKSPHWAALARGGSSQRLTARRGGGRTTSSTDSPTIDANLAFHIPQPATSATCRWLDA